MIIETCPKCGNPLSNITYTTYPPIDAKHCNSCGYHWENKPRPFIEVPFIPPNTDVHSWWKDNFNVDNVCEVKP